MNRPKKFFQRDALDLDIQMESGEKRTIKLRGKDATAMREFCIATLQTISGLRAELALERGE